jgi:hypothetical protein
MPYSHVRTIAGRGAGPGQFRSALRALDVDAQDRLYAAGDSEIKVYDQSGALVRRWATATAPHSVAVGPDGRVFAGEAGQVEIFGDTGRLSETWRHARWFGRVTAIGFSAAGDVLLADAAARIIRHFDADGMFINDIGAGNRMKGFQIPNGVLDFSVDGAGAIVASNPGRHRVERHAIDDLPLGSFGRFDGIDPAGFSGCCNPTNLTVHRGLVYVTEKAGPRAKVYDAAGRLLTVIASSPFDPNCKNMDIAVDRSGRVYVVDTVRLEILAFEGDTEP